MLFLRKIPAIVISLFALIADLQGQGTCTTCEDVAVTISIDACISGTLTATLNGDFLASGTGVDCTKRFAKPILKTVKLKPETPYSLRVAATGPVGSLHLSVQNVPSCYYVVLNGIKYLDEWDRSFPCTYYPPGLHTIAIRKREALEVRSAAKFASSKGGLKGEFALGSLSNGESAGAISLLSGAISSNLFTTSALDFINNVTIPATYDAGGVEVTPEYVTQISSEIDEIRDPVTNALRQVEVPDGLADICTLSPTSYQVCFYPAAQVTGKNSTTGLYEFTGSAAQVFKVSSPTSNAAIPAVKITETAGTVSSDTMISYDGNTKSWLETSPGMDTKNLLETTLPNGDIQIETMISTASGGVISTVREVYHAFPWGSEKITSIVDPGGANLTTSRAFHESAAEDWSYGKLKWEIEADGSFQRYEYFKNHIGSTPNPLTGEDSASFGNVFRVYRIWKDGTDVAGGNHPSTATLANSHVSTYTYTTNGEPGSYFKSDVETTSVSILGQLVSI